MIYRQLKTTVNINCLMFRGYFIDIFLHFVSSERRRQWAEWLKTHSHSRTARESTSAYTKPNNDSTKNNSIFNKLKQQFSSAQVKRSNTMQLHRRWCSGHVTGRRFVVTWHAVVRSVNIAAWIQPVYPSVTSKSHHGNVTENATALSLQTVDDQFNGFSVFIDIPIKRTFN